MATISFVLKHEEENKFEIINRILTKYNLHTATILDGVGTGIAFQIKLNSLPNSEQNKVKLELRRSGIDFGEGEF